MGFLSKTKKNAPFQGLIICYLKANANTNQRFDFINKKDFLTNFRYFLLEILNFRLTVLPYKCHDTFNITQILSKNIEINCKFRLEIANLTFGVWLRACEWIFQPIAKRFFLTIAFFIDCDSLSMGSTGSKT